MSNSVEENTPLSVNNVVGNTTEKAKVQKRAVDEGLITKDFNLETKIR